ncbi:hypothetical protein [Halobaculum rarum]|uniref:hypothetical protein n=1 Tax=Halobaculum rarum TaxID=3075122 RepID=UPI0032B01D57
MLLGDLIAYLVHLSGDLHGRSLQLPDRGLDLAFGVHVEPVVRVNALPDLLVESTSACETTYTEQ